MQKRQHVAVLITCFFSMVSQAYAWRCGQSCPSSYLSGRAECLAYNEACKIDTPSAKDLWGRAGKVAMPAAEKIMKARNKTKEPLSDRLKYALRPIFGNLVDRINVRYNSKMLDKWGKGKYAVNLSGVDTVGQAYGYDVFIAYPESRFESELADMLHLLIHEITHVQQMRDIKNTVADFGYRYFWEYKVANLNYEKNKLEVAADKNANKHYNASYTRYNAFEQRGSKGAIYAIESNGDMFYYKFNGLKDGSRKWAVTGKKIGNGWRFKNVFAGDNGAIYAIDSKADMYYYKFDGLKDGARKWSVTGKKIGNGWRFKHVFAGNNGSIYAIDSKGDMHYYKFDGLKDGARKWAVTSKKIGNGWRFKNVFGGDNGSIYTIGSNGDLLYFKFDGLKDGVRKWSIDGKKIGNGWRQQTVFAGYK